MEGWVELVDLIAPRPGVEPATFRSRVRRRTAAPPRQPWVLRSIHRLCRIGSSSKIFKKMFIILLSRTSDHDCQQTKLEAVELVRWGCEIGWRVWRPTSDWRKLIVHAMFTCFVDFNVHTEHNSNRYFEIISTELQNCLRFGLGCVDARIPGSGWVGSVGYRVGSRNLDPCTSQKCSSTVVRSLSVPGVSISSHVRTNDHAVEHNYRPTARANHNARFPQFPDATQRNAETQLSPKTATAAEFGDCRRKQRLSSNSATNCRRIRRYSRQCGQGFMQHCNSLGTFYETNHAVPAI